MKFNTKNGNSMDIKKAASTYSVIADVIIGDNTYSDIKLGIGVMSGYEHRLLLSGDIAGSYTHLCVCDKSKEYGESPVDTEENRKIADFLAELCPESLATEFTTSHRANWED